MLTNAENYPHNIVMSTIDHLLHISDLYCAATGKAETTVSTLSLKGGHRLGALRNGGDLQTRTLADAFKWFSDNWPENAVWPEHIFRPQPEEVF